jgi:hypothetical protein
MKKLIVSAGLILGFCFMTMSLSAQTAASTDNTKKTQDKQTVQKSTSTADAKVKEGKCTAYADSNKDGVCDNCGSHPATCKDGASKDKNCSSATQMKCSGAAAGSKCATEAGGCKMNSTAKPEKK